MARIQADDGTCGFIDVMTPAYAAWSFDRQVISSGPPTSSRLMLIIIQEDSQPLSTFAYVTISRATSPMRLFWSIASLRNSL